MKTAFLLAALVEEPPEAADVVAGWTGFMVFLGLIIAVALLCWSFTRQIRKAKLAKEAGVYDERSHAEGAQSETAQSQTAQAETDTDTRN